MSFASIAAFAFELMKNGYGRTSYLDKITVISKMDLNFRSIYYFDMLE